MSELTRFHHEYWIDSGIRVGSEISIRPVITSTTSTTSTYTIDMAYDTRYVVNQNHTTTYDITNLITSRSVVSVLSIVNNSATTSRTINWGSGIHAGLWVFGDMPVVVAPNQTIHIRITSRGNTKDTLIFETISQWRSGRVPKHGYFYNWYAVNSGKLEIPGWRIPTRNDLVSLNDFLTTPGSRLKATTPNWDGLDTYGFSALPSGIRQNDGTYLEQTLQTRFWSTSEYSSTFAYRRDLFTGSSLFSESYGDKRNGQSVRLVRNGLTGYTLGEVVRDIDGNVYNTIRISVSGYDAVWLKQNLATTRYNDGAGIPYLTTGSHWANNYTGAICSYENNLNNVFI